MKGLIYKELLLVKKTYIGFLALALGLAILGILVGLGIRYGNIKDTPAEEVTGFFQMFVYFTYTVELFAFSEVFCSVNRDKVTGWRKLEYTMPITAKKQMTARYIVIGIVLVACLLLGLINAGVMALVFRRVFTGAMLKNMVLILLVTMIMFLIGMPLYQRFSFLNVTYIFTGILLVAGLFFSVEIIRNPDVLEELWKYILKNAGRFIDGFLYLSPLIMPVLLAVSFTLSVRAYQRRER